VVQATSAHDSTLDKIATAACPAGKQLIGGGAVYQSDGAEHILLKDSGPERATFGPPPQVWFVVAENRPDPGLESVQWQVTATAYCATVTP
jgi:hypothetical protein